MQWLPSTTSWPGRVSGKQVMELIWSSFSGGHPLPGTVVPAVVVPVEVDAVEVDAVVDEFVSQPPNVPDKHSWHGIFSQVENNQHWFQWVNAVDIQNVYAWHLPSAEQSSYHFDWIRSQFNILGWQKTCICTNENQTKFTFRYIIYVRSLFG